MVGWQGRSNRKASGAKIRPLRGKRRYEMGREPVLTVLGEPVKKIMRCHGASEKVKLVKENYVNVTDTKTNKTSKLKILDVESNKASLEFQRRRVITKGAIVKTEQGKVRITSRPGQQGPLSGVLIEA